MGCMEVCFRGLSGMEDEGGKSDALPSVFSPLVAFHFFPFLSSSSFRSLPYFVSRFSSYSLVFSLPSPAFRSLLRALLPTFPLSPPLSFISLAHLTPLFPATTVTRCPCVHSVPRSCPVPERPAFIFFSLCSAWQSLAC